MSDDDDPFAESADPYPPGDRLGLTRRAALVGSAALAAVVGTAGCASWRIGCVSPGAVRREACAHRFCRYGRARVLAADRAE